MTTRKRGERLAGPGRGGKRKKMLLLDQALLDRAGQALGVRSETEAVRRALEAVLRRETQVRGIGALASLGPIDPVRID